MPPHEQRVIIEPGKSRMKQARSKLDVQLPLTGEASHISVGYKIQ